eukprot:12575297-Alexandrium_andersonii.AAC.1
MKILFLHDVASPCGAGSAPDSGDISPRRFCVGRPYDSGHLILFICWEPLLVLHFRILKLDAP